MKITYIFINRNLFSEDREGKKFCKSKMKISKSCRNQGRILSEKMISHLPGTIWIEILHKDYYYSSICHRIEYIHTSYNISTAKIFSRLPSMSQWLPESRWNSLQDSVKISWRNHHRGGFHIENFAINIYWKLRIYL